METARRLGAMDVSLLLTEPSRKSNITSRLRPTPERTPKVMIHVPRQRELVGDELASALKACIHGEADWPLLVIGPPGVGKTCAALLVVDSFQAAVYTTPTDLHRESCMAERGDLYRNGYRVWFDEFWDKIAKASVVVVDEIGLRSEVTDPHYETLKRLCDLRDHRPAIYLSNVTPEKIASIYDARVLSRMACGTALELRGADRRFSQ
jgi:chromosomal replication initiation ATPase DnaA